MKHHIAVKFLAVFLAALALLAAVGSAAGIICLTAADLYENSVDELYESSTENIRQQFAVNLIHRYASLNYGGVSDQYLSQYYGESWLYNTFQYGYYFYTIYDNQGNVLESTMEQAPNGGTTYLKEVTAVNYRRIIDFIPENPDYWATIPAEDDQVRYETIEEDATLPATAPQPDSTVPTEGPLESTEPTQSSTDATEETILIEVIPENELFRDGYYDYELGTWVDISFVYEELPPYTVELYLLPDAMPEEYAWTILKQVWVYRNELFYVLGGSLLIFAIFAVYLCCAAGKKPGQEEIKAGGLNCIPLDLYLVGGGVVIFLVIALGYQVVDYLLRYSPQVLVPFVVLSGYCCSLMVVGFCFACAAQFKTPGGYSWRNSLVGHCLRLTVRLWNLFVRGCVWTSEHLPPVLARIFRKLWTWTVALARWLLSCALAIWAVAKRSLLYLWTVFKKVCIWCGQKIARFYGMIPLTWQWLLTAFVMIFLLFVGFNAYRGGWFLLCLGIYLAIVLYGTNAFGILMESAKRMGKGDLETKVSDQFLVGSFKEFAGDLNNLADVAVVAAQKQLKSERMKTELITNVSHDIKTPLTSIINYVDLLQKPHTEEEEVTYLEVLSRQSQRLKKLIEDLMEMSKASTGNLAVDITSVNAGEAINQSLGEFADKLEKAQLIPVFRQPEEALYMKADGRLVWRVMSNLLSNAVKYALPGTRLYIDLMELEGKVIISMKNISREELNVSVDELLERFVRGDTSRNTEGSGLGLNIAQSLMELQKGQLQLLVDGDLFKVTLVFPAVQI